MSCDKRGRVYGVSHFNFLREDHVRALFQFARGMPIGQNGDEHWIMLHVANCADFGGLSKRPSIERIDWVKNNSDMIMSVAQNPEANVHLWHKADKPFSFVAGCMELAGIWKNGSSCVTHLPVCFDGSCSGVQHLAMVTRDEVTGLYVNLIPADVSPEVYQSMADGTNEWLYMDLVPYAPPQDVYMLIALRVIKQLRNEKVEVAKANWWLNRGVNRKLIKRPAMTFAYSATIPGMQEHIEEIMQEEEIYSRGDSFFLAKHIMKACKGVLKRPALAMKYIRRLALECAHKGKILEWRTPTGFPWANRYHESNVETVELELLGVRVSHRVADGYEPGLQIRKILDSAAPNFVHALDASHLINVVNTAVSEKITSIATVHDSFACLAPQATELQKIIRTEMAKMYASRDVLADLRAAAGSSLKPPKKGTLDPWSVELSTYAFA
jgi:DNA-directed RNA polymerase